MDSLDTQAAYRRGRAAAESTKGNLAETAAKYMDWARRAYPASARLDYVAECHKLDQERLDAVPDLMRFPELCGMRELLVAERRGFHDGGYSPEWTAYHYTWSWFVSRRLNTRYVGTAAQPAGCTQIFFARSDQGPLSGGNRDVPYWSGGGAGRKEEGPDGKRRVRFAGVSAAVMCDEEPKEIFPVDVFGILPPDCRKLRDIVALLERYSDFWGPGNNIVTDLELDSVAIEKSNCRMGVRPARNGASAITACSYQTPEMKAFKLERDRLSLERRGWTEDCPDWVYWRGCDRRYERLLRLVADEAARGPTLGGLLDILLDHKVPFPDRICLAGELIGHPQEVKEDAGWSMDTSAAALEGPTRRAVARHVQDRTPVYEVEPIVTPGEGVEMRPEWLDEARSHNGG